MLKSSSDALVTNRKLQLRINTKMKRTGWELEEKSYWERRAYYLSPKPHFDHRILEREKCVFRFLRDKIRGKRLLEVGCGTSYSVRDCLNPLQYSYFYVGTDIALEPLRTAKKFIQDGDFVQCAASEMPFKASVFDVVLCLGVIHHLPGGEENVLLLSNFVGKDGYFIAAEPMAKKSPLQHSLSRAFETKFEKQSPHENRLDKERFMKNVQKIGELVAFHKNCSPVMTSPLFNG